MMTTSCRSSSSGTARTTDRVTKSGMNTAPAYHHRKTLTLRYRTGPSHIAPFYDTTDTLTALHSFRYDGLLFNGPVAQLGARMTGSHEVRGSNHLRSTLESKRKAAIRRPFLFWGVLLATACHARYSIAGNCGGTSAARHCLVTGIRTYVAYREGGASESWLYRMLSKTRGS